MLSTKHLQQRMSQRGVNKDMVELAWTYGAQEGDKYILGRKEALSRLEALQSEARLIKKVLDKGGIVVVASEDALITSYNCQHRRH
ncbi:DUF4258 domain-containing protein [Caballeronia novacaledonica]|uniref:DUF4258 domain-containing protein n=1 Tax=Caballeronia novacaledonica TaxID=1544861 RepID=UPI001EE19800|nr:DUF4258 domain-containing protein [Caballeronia novacaledonica]GJH13585.1 DUF4258 domain-containing protein [Caballeronia novacaledonica]